MNRRIKALASLLKQHKIDAYLVTKDVNISYLTDFPASDSWLFVTPKQTFYITDFRYMSEAKRGLKGATVVQYTKSIGATTLKVASLLRIKRLGFNSCNVTVSDFRKLKKSLHTRVSLVCVDNLVEKLREIKSAGELNKIKSAIRLHAKAYDFLRSIIKPNMTERQLLHLLDGFVKDHNASFSFLPIIASGSNSSFPHAKITDRRIKKNEPILVDMGIDFAGYKSDLTRVFFLGKIPPLIKNTYIKVRKAQQAAINKIRANIRVCTVDQEARNYLKRNHLGKFFGHSLGHGIGREVHECPAISSENRSLLKEGMVFTVEPAVYIPNKFGIRVEDMVLVTKNGCKVLSESCSSAPIVL